MSKDASKVYRFPAIDIELQLSGSSSYTSSGLTSPNVSIIFTGEGQEDGVGQMIPTNGLGVVSVELIQSAQSDLNLIKSGSQNTMDVRFTDLDGNQYTVSDVYLNTQLNRAAGPGAHTLTYTGQRRVTNMDDFVTFN